MRALAQQLADKLVNMLGGPHVMVRRGALFARAGFTLVIVFGLMAWWTPQFCALVTALSVTADALGRHAQQMEG